MLRLIKTGVLLMLLGTLFYCGNSKKRMVNNYIDSIADIAAIGNKAEDIYQKAIYLNEGKKDLSDTNFMIIIQEKIIPQYNHFLDEASGLGEKIKMNDLKKVHQYYITGIKYMADAFPLMVKTFEITDEKEKSKIIKQINDDIKKSKESLNTWSSKLVIVAAANYITSDDIQKRLSKKITKNRDYLKNKKYSGDDLLKELKLK